MSTYPPASLLESTTAERPMYTEGGPWDDPNMDSEPGKSQWWTKGNPEEIPHKSDSSYQAGMTPSLSLPMCLSTHILFPPNKHLTCFSTFQICGNSFLFCTGDGLGPCQWASALVTRIWHSHFWNSTSISGQEKIPFFKPLQANATRDENHKAKAMH